MTVNQIVDELRATRPTAGEALRLQVLTLASTPPVDSPSLGDRLRGRRPCAARPARRCGARRRLGGRDRRHTARPDRAGGVRANHLRRGAAQHRRGAGAGRDLCRPGGRLLGRPGEGGSRPGRRAGAALRRKPHPRRRGHGRALRGDPARPLDRARPRRLRRLGPVRHGHGRGGLTHPPRSVHTRGRRGHAALRSRHDRRAERPDRRPAGVAGHARRPARATPGADRRAERRARARRDGGRAGTSPRAARAGAGTAPRASREPGGDGRGRSQRDDPARSPHQGGLRGRRTRVAPRPRARQGARDPRLGGGRRSRARRRPRSRCTRGTRRVGEPAARAAGARTTGCWQRPSACPALRSTPRRRP